MVSSYNYVLVIHTPYRKSQWKAVVMECGKGYATFAASQNMDFSLRHLLLCHTREALSIVST